MITLATGGSLKGKAGTATAVTYTISGDAVTTTDAFQILGQGQLAASTGDLLTTTPVPASTSYLIKNIVFTNATASPVTGIILYVNGTAAGNEIVQFSLVANGSAVYNNGGWQTYDSSGNLLFGSGFVVTVTAADGSITVGGTASNPTISRAALTGDITASAGSNTTTLATVNTVTPGTYGSATAVPTITVNGKGLTTASSSTAIQITESQVTNLATDLTAKAPTSRLINTTAPLTGGGDLSADRTLAISAATTSAAGSQSALDKKKEDNMYYDVTANAIAILVGDDSTDNASAWSTLFAALPVGAHVHFPEGTYRTSAEFAISADKHLRITGGGMYTTTIKTTSITANIFHINGSYWENTFENLRFDSTVTKTAGAAISIDPGAAGSAVSTNIRHCSFTGQFIAIDAQGAQAANASYWDNLDIAQTPVNGRGIRINGSTINLGITNSIINCGFPPFQVAGTACIEINQSGAVQMLNLECIGGINTLLLNANQGASTSIAAVFATNCFFDQSGGSTLKITGANVVNRCKFVQCGITGGNIAAPIAIEIASSGTGGAGTATAAADGIDFFDCDIYPNGGSGTMNGIQITGAQGVAINSCRISGWTNGVSVTPAVSNGYTKIFMTGNKMGATNNFTTPNTVGVLLNAGSFQYGSVIVEGNDFSGSTTPYTDNSTVTGVVQKAFEANIGVVNSGGTTTIPSAAQALTASAANLLTGSSIALTTGQLHIGSQFKWTIGLIKTAAGAATWTASVKFGTANTTADAAIATWTSGTNTAAIDQATLTIVCEVTAIGGTATAKCIAMYVNTLTNATGLGVVNFAPGSTATFNASATTPFLHVDVTPGASAVMTAVAVAECLTA